MRLTGVQSLPNDAYYTFAYASFPSVLTSPMPGKVQHGNVIDSLASEDKMVTSGLETTLAILAVEPRGYWEPCDYLCSCPDNQSHLSFLPLDTMTGRQPLFITQLLISFVNFLIGFVASLVADIKVNESSIIKKVRKHRRYSCSFSTIWSILWQII